MKLQLQQTLQLKTKSIDIAVNRAQLQLDIAVEWTAGGIVVTPDFNKGLTAKKDVVIIIAQYDENNAMVDYSEQYVPLGSGTGRVETYTTALTPVANASAKTVKVYVWSGTNINDAGEEALLLDVKTASAPIA